MGNNFLDIIKVSAGETGDNLVSLRNYYCSEKLGEDISVLINNRIEPCQFRDKRILLKPNWVRHSVKPEDEFCLRTHDRIIINVIKALIDHGPRMIVIGDAPVQGCRWEQMISQSFLNEIAEISARSLVPVHIKDFRRRIFEISKNSPETEVRPLSEYLVFDLGKKSFLEPVTNAGEAKFRVTNYNPSRMTKAHSPGIHKYCIAREFLDSDIVISLPKIKTHEKSGITGALKNIVGINGDKDFLPHHRLGGSGRGGDCYPGESVLRYWAEIFLDQANYRQGRRSYRLWQFASSVLWYSSFPGPRHKMTAGWHGNDTTWRMVLDLNLIAMYGKPDGTISDEPQRNLFSLCDAVIAGQGNGPLNPIPLPMGIISFTNNSFINDKAIAGLMGFLPERIPLIKHAESIFSTDVEVTFNHQPFLINDISQQTVQTIPPDGWGNHLYKMQY